MVEEVRRQAEALLGRLASRRPWLRGKLEDATNEVMLVLVDRGGEDVWGALMPRRFGSPEARDARRLLFGAIQTVSDRFRRRRRVEIRPGAPGYDEGAGKARRQRRTIPPDRPLTQETQRIVAPRVEGDLRLDVRDALLRLDPEQRAVVYGRVVGGKTWDELAGELQLSIAQARGRFASAVSHLARWLEEYEGLG